MSYKELTSRHPYYDDFNPDLNFLRILFNPGRAVQARELTQLQTILQNQLSSAANHFFKNNSTVLGAKISTNANKPGVTIHNKQVVDRVSGALSPNALTSLVSVENLVGKRFINRDPTVFPVQAPTSSLKITQAILDPNDSAKIHLYFTFSGETPTANSLYFEASNGALVVKCESDFFNAIAARCDAGVVYRNGHFLSVVEQECIVGNDQALQYNIGFRFDERVITDADPYYGSLLRDPASGFYNANAPGASRYQIFPVLDSYREQDAGLLSDEFKKAFTTYLSISNRAIIFDQRETQYSQILDLLARRTYDESGNYVVDNFNLTVKDASTESNLSYELSPGKAYVLGYETRKLSSEQIVVPKARTSQAINSTYARSENHFYFVIRNTDRGIDMVGLPDLSTRPLLSCYSKQLATGAVDAGLIGTCRAEGLQRVGNEWRLYVSEIDSIRNHLKSVRSLRQTIVGSPFSTNGFNVSTIADPNVTGASVNSGGRRRQLTSFSTNASKTSATGSQYQTALFRGDQFPLVYPVKGATFLKNVFSGESSFTMMATRSCTFVSTGPNSAEAVITAENDKIRFRTDDVSLVAFETGVFAGGSTLPETGDVTFTVDNLSSPNTITIEITGTSGTAVVAAANKNARVFLKEELVEAQPRQKTLTTVVEKKTLPFNSVDFTDKTKTLLNREDGFSLVRIKIVSNALGGGVRELTPSELSKVKFDSGQKDTYYDVATVSSLKTVLLPLLANSSAPTDVEITYSYFEHSNADHQHFFTVSSYPFNEANLDLIPSYRAKANGKNYDLVNCVDFRVKKSEMSAGKKLIVPDDFFNTDVETYLPRIDKIWINATNEFGVTQGIPSLTPEAPNDVQNTMTLYVVNVRPFTKDRKDVVVQSIDNRRYTMRDIGSLEKRIERLEVYTSMNLLEQAANTVSIIDAGSGFDKFKSGIFADPLISHEQGDVKNDEYRVAVIQGDGGAICPFSAGSVELTVERPDDWVADWFLPANVTFWDNTVTLEVIAEEVMAKNDYASGGLNVNPYLFYVWNGEVKLDPAIDTWYDTRYAPERNNVTGPDVPAGTSVFWGEWETNWIGTSNTTYTEPSIAPGGTRASITATTVSTREAISETRFGVAITYRPTSTTTVDDRVIDVSAAPYMRPITVRFDAKGMRQGMTVKGYLDGVEIPITVDTSFLGKTDADGKISGFFQIPEGIFLAGTKTFLLRDDEETSEASAPFTSQGTVTTRQRTVTTVRGVEEIRRTISDVRGIEDPLPAQTTTFSQLIWVDPIAQSFLVNSTGGAFLSSIEIFFKKKPTAADDPEERAAVSVYLVEMENGYPTQNIIPFSKVTLNWNEVNADATFPSLGRTVFEFSDAIYLEDQTEYAFVVYSSSRLYEVWISTLGQLDVFQGGVPEGGNPNNRTIGVATGQQGSFVSSRFRNSSGQVTISGGQVTPDYLLNRPDPSTGFSGGSTGRGIESQPYLGSLFKSQNSSTWTADQTSDITFRINKCVFTAAQGDVYFTDAKYQVNSKPGTVPGGNLGRPYYNDTENNLAGQYGEQKKMSIAMLSIGDLVLPGTQMKYATRFFSGEPTSGISLEYVQNKKNRHLGTENVLDFDNHFVCKAEMKSANANISPVIDTKQNRVIGISYETLADEDETVLDAGTYVSKAVKLLNGADDLKVILDAQLPDSSRLDVYFKTQQNVPEYFEPEPGVGGHAAGLFGVASEELVGDVVTLYGYTAAKIVLIRGGAPGTDQTPTNMVITSMLPAVDNGGLQPPRVYFRSLSTFYNQAVPHTPFSSATFSQLDAPGTLYVSKMLFSDSEPIIPNLASAPLLNGNPYVDCPGWTDLLSSGQYAVGSLVYHQAKIWRRAKIADALLPNPMPVEGSEDWISIPGIFINSQVYQDTDGGEWRKMVLEQEPNPLVDTRSQLVEYSYKPEIAIESEFLQFQVKIEAKSSNSWNMPVFKNVRAIAAI